MGWLQFNYFVSEGSLLSLSLCNRGFQDLLTISTSALFMLYGCISSSMAALMSQSTHLVLQKEILYPVV